MYIYNDFIKHNPMKRILTLTFVCSMFLGYFVNAQSTRLVLIEEATNASCGPCASQNPAFDVLLNANRDKLTAIKYHWYYPGYDPMQNHNPEENNARVSYYGINGVPTATIDGVIPNGPTFSYPGGPHGYTQALIDEYAAVPSPLVLSLGHHLSADEDTIFIDMMIQASEAIAEGRRAHMAVVEKNIHFASAPGSNGEKDFLDVMKKMVPDEGGTVLPALNAGEYIILQNYWVLANIYDMDELGVVGFVQNNATKAVLQAANSSSDPLTPLYNVDCDVTLGVSNMSETNCSGEIEPVVTVRNNGSSEITSMEISYDVNGEESFSYTWNGNLSFLNSTDIALPGISFGLEETNYLNITVTTVNGQDDDYATNNVLVHAFDRAAITPTTVKLMLRTDDHPEETTWEIFNSQGEVVVSGGPYANSGTIYQETMEVADLDCYTFKIYDAGGDGLTIPGFYALYYGSNSYITTGTEFGSVDSAKFEANTTIGIEELNPNTSISLYPNPARENVTVQLQVEGPANVTIQVYNLTGGKVIERSYGMVSPGRQFLELGTGELTPGMYLLKLDTGKETIARRLTIIK